MSLARVVITAVLIEGRSKSEVARDVGMSRQWVRTLVQRYLAEGDSAFEPRSRRPHSNPRRVVTNEVEEQIVGLRNQLSDQGLDAGARPSAGTSNKPTHQPEFLGGNDVADPGPPRLPRPAAPQTTPVVVEAVRGRTAQRALAGQHHPLAAGRRHGDRDPSM